MDLKKMMRETCLQIARHRNIQGAKFSKGTNDAVLGPRKSALTGQREKKLSSSAETSRTRNCAKKSSRREEALIRSRRRGRSRVRFDRTRFEPGSRCCGVRRRRRRRLTRGGSGTVGLRSVGRGRVRIF